MDEERSSEIDTGPGELDVDVPAPRSAVVIVVVVEGRSGVVSNLASVGEKAVAFPPPPPPVVAPLDPPLPATAGPGLVRMPCSKEVCGGGDWLLPGRTG